MKRDPAAAALRSGLALGTTLLLGVTGIALSLQPVGAFTHIEGMVEQLCTTFPHLTSDVAALALVALVTASASSMLVTLVSSLIIDRRTSRRWRLHVGPNTARARDVARSIGVTFPLFVFSSSEPIACSRGVRAPAIWISDVAVDTLDDAELAAVLAHEAHHCRMRDSGKRQALEILSRTLFAFPVMGYATSRFRRAAEFAADDAASSVTSRRATATALLRFADTRGVAHAVQFGAAATNACCACWETRRRSRQRGAPQW
jgi:Zn-dependent protease with chaperone function